jgi:hypothetical protein
MSESAKNYHTVEACRVGTSHNLISVLNLGHQALTGVFPKSREPAITRGPLELVWSIIPLISQHAGYASGRGARPSTLPAKFFAVIGFANSVLLRQIEA